MCYEYSDNPVVNDSVWINSKEYSLMKLWDDLYWDLVVYPDDHYDYLIIYTQMRECDLQDFIYELRQRERSYVCRQLVLACMD